jgi:hypothetical protein
MSIQIIEVNAKAREDLAREWGVLSLPTTFILDSQGRPRGINHGVAGARKLAQQLEAIGELSIRNERGQHKPLSIAARVCKEGNAPDLVPPPAHSAQRGGHDDSSQHLPH